MKLIRSVKLKLENVNPNDLLPTFRAYTEAYNYICEIGFKDCNFDNVELPDCARKPRSLDLG